MNEKKPKDPAVKISFSMPKSYHEAAVKRQMELVLPSFSDYIQKLVREDVMCHKITPMEPTLLARVAEEPVLGKTGGEREIVQPARSSSTFYGRKGTK